MIDVTNLVKIEYHGEPVLTTKQLAAAYECAPTHIRDNFKNNKRYFQEGVHYFKLTGDELREFKLYVNTEISRAQAESENTDNFRSPIVTATSSLLLWTKAGCVRHCKMLGTPKAWEMFNLLENAYFAISEQPKQIDAPPDLPDKFTVREKVNILMKCAEMTSLDRLRNPIIRKIATLVFTH